MEVTIHAIQRPRPLRGFYRWTEKRKGHPTAAPRDRPQKHPSRDAVIRLGLALKLSIEDMDGLLLAGGYAPLIR